jgi:hypothetical protein
MKKFIENTIVFIIRFFLDRISRIICLNKRHFKPTLYKYRWYRWYIKKEENLKKKL